MSLVSTNYTVSQIINLLYSTVNGNCTFNLYQNNITPTPASVLTDFQPASFAGYAPWSTTGKFTTPIKQQDGIYEITASAGPWLCTSGSQTIYGGIISNGTNLLYAQVFPAPFVVQVNTYFSIPITIQSVSSQL